MTKISTASFTSLVEPVFDRVKNDPEQLAVIFIGSDEEEQKISVGKLHSAASFYARTLKESGIKQGDIVIIATGHCPDLLFAFWGTLYIGAVPSIFSYKGPMSTKASYIERLKKMAQNSNARIVITTPGLISTLKESLTGTDCRALSAGVPADLTNENSFFPREKGKEQMFTSGEQIAYIQYTSGTTGKQKGVKLSHRAILGFVQAFARALKIQNSDVIVNWLPLYHDFGLFAGFISPLIFELPGVLLSPFKWLRNPKTLLSAVHKYRGTISFLPNSAHNHMVRYVSFNGDSDLDLSSLRVLINGAEPILFESQETFLTHFAPYGLKETALSSGYGMAENTLGVTFNPVGKRAPVDWISIKEMQSSRRAIPAPPRREGSKANVSSGVPLDGMAVAVVDEKGRRLPERHIGEIIFRSGSLFSGYHEQRDTNPQAAGNGWYHSGDLGYLVSGELYVCGRKKDMIIVGGNNICPEDLEAAAGNVPGIEAGAVAAFGVLDEEMGTEKIVMICGLERPVDETGKLEIERSLRRRIFREFDVTLGEVHLRGKRSIIKAQNGKITRTGNREKYKQEFISQAK